MNFNLAVILKTAELIAYCKERMAAYKYPRVVEIRSDLPKNAMGKILKEQLVAPAGSAAGRS
jgi:long-chain acyl-CoA synthetase